MKKPVITVVATIILASLVFYLFREPLKQAAYDQLTRDMFVDADTDDFDPGPALGSQFPGLRARYQGRDITLITEFAGELGTVLVASRSLDWCPYCMRQLVEMQALKEEYDTAGIAMIAITYDDPLLQKAFADKFDISIPILSDVDALSFKTLGILNEQYQPGDMQYGIPHPGMIVIDSKGKVVGKLFLEAYSSRVGAAAALDFAQQALSRQ